MKTEPPQRRKRSRSRRVLGVLGSVIGLTITFTAGAAVGAIAHLDTTRARRLVATQVNGILDKTFEGKVHIEHIGHLGLRGIDGVRVRVWDPDGVQVLHVDDVRVRVNTSETLRSLVLSKKGPIVIEVPSASIGNADVNLDPDGGGVTLRLERAFTPRPSTTSPPPEPTTTEPSRVVQVEVPNFQLGHAWAHGAPPGAPLVDVDLHGLAAHAHITSKIIRADLDRVSFVSRAMPRRLDPKGTLGGHFQMPAANGQGMDVRAVFDGEVGGMPTTAEARMDDQRVDARIDTRDATGRSAQAIVTEVKVEDPLTIHGEAHGQLPHVNAKAKVTLGGATVDANAAIDLGSNKSSKTTIAGGITARHIDLSAIESSAPSSDLGFDAHANLEIGAASRVGGETAIKGEADLDTVPGRIDKYSIPPVEVRSSFINTTARVRARIYEKTLPTEIAVSVNPRSDRREGQRIDLSVRSSAPDLRHVPKVGSWIAIGGSASLEATAQLLLPEKSFDAKVTLEGKKIAKGAMGVGLVNAEARAKGTIDRPVIDTEVHAKDIGLEDNKFPVSSTDARAHIEIAKSTVVVRDARVDLVRAGHALSATAQIVKLVGGAMRVDGAEIKGLGDPIRADLSKDAREIRAKVDAPKIDLGIVAKVADLEKSLRGGTVGIRGQAVLRNNGDATADIHGELAGLEANGVKNGRGKIDASIDGREVAFDATAELADAGRVSLRAERVVLGGRVNDPKAWRDAYGKVQLDGEIDMEKMTSLFIPPDRLPVADLRGQLSIQGRIGRDEQGAPPEVQLHAHTNGLIVVGKVKAEPPINGVAVESANAWRSNNVDLGVDVRNDGASGLTTVSLRATDPYGAIVALDAKTYLPYVDMVRDPSIAKEQLMTAPIATKIVIPPRRLDQLPGILGVKNMQGAVQADLDVTGTVRDPRVHLVARGRGIVAPGIAQNTKADSDVTFDYDGNAADLFMTMHAKGKPMLDVTAHAEARARDLLGMIDDSNNNKAKRPFAFDWNASAKVVAAGLPLQMIPQIADRHVHGLVSGEVTLDGLHKDAKVKGRLDLAKLRVGRARYEKGAITVDVGGGRGAAKVRLDQTDGFLDASAKAGLVWGADVVPKLDAKQPVEAKIVAKAFRAAVIQPFVESVLPVFDGRIEADATARMEPGKPGAALDGHLSFHDGTVQPEVLGEELRNVKADIVFTPEGTIKLTQLSARGSEGEIHGSGSAKIDGLRIADANAVLEIPKKKAFSVALQGTPLGQVAGTIKLHASQAANDGQVTTLVIEVPQLDVELPHVQKTDLQSLEEKQKVRVGVYRDPKSFLKLPLDKEDTKTESSKDEERSKAEASRIDVDVRIARIDIQRGNSARVSVQGHPKITVGADTRIVGQIETLPGGWVDVHGKKFDIEKGTVTFNGEVPPDPIVNLTAGWTAADGSRVYADFIGPVKTGKVTLRSEPARPKDEILALVLFGTPDGANPTPASSGQGADGTTKTAVGLGGGFAAEGLTEALDDLAGIQATARVDTTSANNPRPEIEFQLSPKVSIAFQHVIGQPPVTEPDTNLAKATWRFHRNWALETTAGDRGKGVVDATWLKRY